MKESIKKSWLLFLIASLSLGLAPFKEPHILGKLKWIAGGNAFRGNDAMKFMDWFDTFLHGMPWILLLTSTALHIISRFSKN
ncbi:hypothetical protein [Tenacibaculum sp. 190524A05c]|uniref:RND transporter n=1 Tax=Tenacibaculum platacis TaxID=3137852 RepID=A0ABM9P2S8_9FLAO